MTINIRMVEGNDKTSLYINDYRVLGPAPEGQEFVNLNLICEVEPLILLGKIKTALSL